ncbi:MAG: PEP/pyruvate-binding domain-containing protein, partial [Betaproteobacteria bacterium]
EWERDADSLLSQIRAQLGAVPLIVRSSAAAEDQAEASQAGRYRSVADVASAGDDAALRSAIEAVIAAYDQPRAGADDVLVQPMLDRILISGVALTRDPSTGAPYRVINYAAGGDASAVTSGAPAALLTFVATRAGPDVPPALASLFNLIDELEGIFPECALDIEFAIDADARLFLLQVRPLRSQPCALDDAQHRVALERVAARVAVAQRPDARLLGSSTMFGNMPDWNPAELIGVRPKPLALSLFRRLVTDSAWSGARHRYGYRDLREVPLLTELGGQPYIDLRISFNSFLPADIDAGLGHRLVDHYLALLAAAPALHDTVEFQVVLSCYTFDIDQRLDALAAAGFDAGERRSLAASLRRLTSRIVDPMHGVWRRDRDRLALLDRRRCALLAVEMAPISRLHRLLDDCLRYGTRPFAGLARTGFVAVQMLRSLVAVGALSAADHEAFMRGVDTVSGRLSRELRAVDRATFLARYGHLRPGTFDIAQPRYDETPDAYFDWDVRPRTTTAEAVAFVPSSAQRRAIDALLRAHALPGSAAQLLEFIRCGIEWREQAKFMFTRSLSDALSILRAYGATHGLSAAELAFARIEALDPLRSGGRTHQGLLRESIAAGQAAYRETGALWLPSLITKPADVLAFVVPAAEPNFITQRSVTGPVVRIDQRERLCGGIVFVERADPGYDWLFAQRIGGLVTAYGGSNSHMAIRAAELGLPAVIGAGTAYFERWGRASRLALDCAARRVEMLA